MARHRRAGLLASTALAVATICAAGAGVSRSRPRPRDPSVPSLFDPHFEARDGRPQQFRKPGAVATVSSGAGTTGFDATNSRARRKAKEDARKRARAEAENLPPVVPAGPDRTVAPVFQRQESAAATSRRAINTAAAPLEATGAIAPRPIRKRLVEDDPFGPVGFYRGSFLVKPALEMSGGYNSNPGQRQNGKGSTFEKIASESNIKSNWSQHELSADLKGSYIWYNADKLDNLLQARHQPEGQWPHRHHQADQGRFRGPLQLCRRQSRRSQPAERCGQAADLHHRGRHRRHPPRLQPAGIVAEGHDRFHDLWRRQAQ